MQFVTEVKHYFTSLSKLIIKMLAALFMELWTVFVDEILKEFDVGSTFFQDLNIFLFANMMRFVQNVTS